MEVTTKRTFDQGSVLVETTSALSDAQDVLNHIEQFFAVLDSIDIEETDDIVSISITVVRRERLN